MSKNLETAAASAVAIVHYPAGWMRCDLRLLGFLAVLLTASCTPLTRLAEHTEGEAAAMVLRYAEKYHYSNIRADDRVSRAALENYLAALDGQRLYFTGEDEEYFRTEYGHRLDDAMRLGQLDPVLEIYRLYQRRRAEFWDFAENYLNTRADLNTSREWILDRSGAPRPSNQAELKELSRDWVRHEWISLLLEDRSYEAARALLRHRHKIQRNDEEFYSESPFTLFLDAFARALDSRSRYSSPRSIGLSIHEPSKRYGDVGALLDAEGDQIVVRSVWPGSPAATVGQLQPGDRIVGMDVHGHGEILDVAGWKPADVRELMRGLAGTPVVLRVLPVANGTETFEVRMKRAAELQLWQEAEKRSKEPEPPKGHMMVVEEWIPSNVEKKVLEVRRGAQTLKIGAIRIRKFYRNCARDVKRLINALKTEEVDGLVVDLRDNPGGKSDEAIALTGMFLGKGPIFQMRDRRRQVRVLHNRKQGVIWNGPLAVLVNQRSASNSEVFSAAIQDYGRGVVVGQRTLGKGTMNVDYTVKVQSRGESKNATLTITTHKSYRVTGGSFQIRGVEPDILLPAAGANWSIGRRAAQHAFGPSMRDPADGNALPWDEIPAVDFSRLEMPRLQLVTLSALHHRRESQDAYWRLLTGQLESERRLKDRQRVPLHVEQRREDRAAELAEEIALAKAWLKANGSTAFTAEPALFEAMVREKKLLLPGNLAFAAEEPALVKALMLARGYVFAADASEYRIDIYDLALEQTARIAADLAQLQESAAPASSAAIR